MSSDAKKKTAAKKPTVAQPESEKYIRVNLTIPKELHKRVKMFAVVRDMTLMEAMRDLMAMGFNAWDMVEAVKKVGVGK